MRQLQPRGSAKTQQLALQASPHNQRAPRLGDPGSGSSPKGSLRPSARPRDPASGFRDLLELLVQHHAGWSGTTDACAARALPPQTPTPSAPLPQETFWASPGGQYLRRHRWSGQGPSQAPSEGKHDAASSAEKGNGRHSSLNSSSCVFLTGREQRLHNCGRPALGGSAPPPEGGGGRGWG